MNAVEVISISRDAIWTLLKVGAPVMLIALIIGLGVSLFQALTQIKEMTLAFVPKIIVIFVSVLVLLPFMLASLNGFMEQIVDKIVALG
jgi:flagellar biosynthetic protein FliQ